MTTSHITQKEDTSSFTRTTPHTDTSQPMTTTKEASMPVGHVLTGIHQARNSRLTGCDQSAGLIKLWMQFVGANAY